MVPLLSDAFARAADRFTGVQSDLGDRFARPADVAAVITPDARNTQALQVIDDALVRLSATSNGRLIVSMPPQEGKSWRVSLAFPIWRLSKRPNTRIVMVSYAQRIASNLGRQVRDAILNYPSGLDMAIRPDVAGRQEWVLEGHSGGVYAVGIGGALTSRSADLMIIDDPHKDGEEAASALRRQKVWDWWLEVGSTRLAPGAQVAVVQTRWHEDDFAGRLLSADDGGSWDVLNIAARADHRPELGQTDPLGRKPGEYMLSAREGRNDEWESIEIRSGSRVWSSMYQGRPAPESGDVWKREWWRRYSSMLWTGDGSGGYVVDGMDEVIQSWDMAFKDTKASDFVVGQVWGRRGADVFLLEQVRKRLSFTDTLAEVLRVTARWPQSSSKFVEDKANGSAVIDTLKSKVPGLIPVNPTTSKYSRAQAVAPYIEAGNVHVPDKAIELFPVDELIDEAAAFPTGKHDDQVDATSQALHRLLGDGFGAAAWVAAMRSGINRKSEPPPQPAPVAVDGVDPREVARQAQFRASQRH